VLVCPTEIGIAGLRLVEEVLGTDEAAMLSAIMKFPQREGLTIT
jgi:hypothetical protein